MKRGPKQIFYEDMIIGRTYVDNQMGSYWIAKERILGGMIMQNNKPNGIIFHATNETCHMKFYDA